jgi:plasmid stabilization system protein ParE
MALPFDLSEDAVYDLEEAVGYLAAENPPAALRLADELEQTFLFLAQWPSAGRRREDLTEEPELRFWSNKDYLIGYFGNRSPILIVCVLHGSRDAASILAPRLGRL